MAELNERIAADERVDSVLLGLSDGVTLARRPRGLIRTRTVWWATMPPIEGCRRAGQRHVDTAQVGVGLDLLQPHRAAVGQPAAAADAVREADEAPVGRLGARRHGAVGEQLVAPLRADRVRLQLPAPVEPGSTRAAAREMSSGPEVRFSCSQTLPDPQEPALVWTVAPAP